MLCASSDRIEDIRMSDCMLSAVGLTIKALGREHVAVVFGHHEAFVRVGNVRFLGDTSVRTDMAKVVVCIHVLKKMAVLKESHASCGT